MGNRKKFIDKKKSATFQLIARDTTGQSPLDPLSSDRVFVRVDRNPCSAKGFSEDIDEGCCLDTTRTPCFDASDPNSIFADASEDDSDEEMGNFGFPKVASAPAPLPDSVRREILELGLPDDGYNYLLHLREIKNTGAGSSFYHNSKAQLNRVPLDIKAYDASKLQIHQKVEDDPISDSIYNVASKTVGARVQRVFDPDIAALLDDGDLSQFGSDAEEIDEDFIVQANQLDGEGLGDNEIGPTNNFNSLKSANCSVQMHKADITHEFAEKSIEVERGNGFGCEKPRVQRFLDEQFDLLTLCEYDSNDDVDSVASENETLAAKLGDALKDYAMDDTNLSGEHRAPADFFLGNEELPREKQLDPPADVIRKCREYAEIYNEEFEDEDLVVVQESSDESEIWDCETIISTYSNLDNHPGKIPAPEKPRKKVIPTFSEASKSDGNIISLQGKKKLPMDFLSYKRNLKEKSVKVVTLDVDQQKRRRHGEESKEEKKERKSAVKEERREARRAKKEMRGLYKFEAQRAQRVSAVSGPSSIHLM